MWAIVVSVATALYQAGWVTKGLALLGAWLLPSPVQKLIDKQKAVDDAEAKADKTGDVSDLDEI